MNFQEKYDALDKEILQAAKERNFKLKDEKVKIQKRIAYLLSLEKEIEDSDKKILKLSKEGKSNEEIENELLKQENLQHKLDLATKNEYLEVFNEVNGYRIVKGLEGYGLIDGDGKEITKEKYDSIGNINKYGVAKVYKNGKCGLVDGSGKLITPIVYERINDFSEGFAVVEKDNKYGLIDTTGKVILPTKYKELTKVIKGNLLYQSEFGKISYGMMNTKGEILHKPEYGYSSKLLENGYAIVSKDGQKGVLNNKGELIVPIKYDDINDSDVLKGGLIGVSKYGNNGGTIKKGKVTPEGEEVIAPIYNNIEEIGGLDGVYRVKLTSSKNNLVCEGLIDKNGKMIVVPDKYYHICDFKTRQDGKKFAEVRKRDKNKGWEKKGLIDDAGKEVIHPLYAMLTPVYKNDDYYKVSKQKLFGEYKYGYVDLEGNEYFGREAEYLEDGLN